MSSCDSTKLVIAASRGGAVRGRIVRGAFDLRRGLTGGSRYFTNHPPISPGCAGPRRRRPCQTIPSGNLFPLVAGAPQAKTRPEVYAMGFRNPFRVQVDENDVAYISDYSPDANAQQRSRGPSGTGRYEIVRKPSNYGWPTCYKRDLALLQVELPRVRAQHHDVGHAAEHPGGAARVRRPDAAQRLAVEPRGRPVGRARPRRRAARSPTRTSGTRTATTTRRRRSARRASATPDRRRGRSRPARPPSARGCSPSSTPAASARTAPRSTTTTPPTRTRRSSRRTTTTR